MWVLSDRLYHGFLLSLFQLADIADCQPGYHIRLVLGQCRVLLVAPPSSMLFLTTRGFRAFRRVFGSFFAAAGGEHLVLCGHHLACD